MKFQLRPWFALLTALAISTPGHPQSSDPIAAKSSAALTAKDVTFRSPSLGRDVRYRLLLPRGYSASESRFPVLYLLHGLYGDYRNWDTRTDIEGYAESLPLIIVMPDGGDSWYANSVTAANDKFEDYVAKDLIAEVDNRFRTIRSRDARAIAGLSMGGYGAIKFALKYPQLFAFAGSLSGAFDATRGLDTRVPQFREKLLLVFGEAGSEARAANDLFVLLQKADSAGLPYLYVSCGAEDAFLPINREFVSNLPVRRIAYEYHETPGGHTWEYWNHSALSLLRSMAEVLRIASH